MRTSSVKSAVSALMIATTLVLTVPAGAVPARDTRTSRGDAIIRTVLNILRKISRVVVTGGPSIPLGDKAPCENCGIEAPGASAQSQ